MTAGVGCARPSRHALLDVFPIVCLLLLPACSLICLQPLLHHASSNFCPCCGLTDCGFFCLLFGYLGGGRPRVAPMSPLCLHPASMPSRYSLAACHHARCMLVKCPRAPCPSPLCRMAPCVCPNCMQTLSCLLPVLHCLPHGAFCCCLAVSAV